MACLGVLWTLGKGTVRDVAVALEPRQRLAYSTVMTLLDRLEKRGELTRQKSGRRFVYTPVRDPDELRAVAIDELVRDYFGGSAEALRTWLDRGAAAKPKSQEALVVSIDTALL
jgi:predicted transcriptional regulator